MRRFLVASFLAEVTQQIHSFRASGVIAAQRSLAAASDSMARRRSDGSLWSVPPVFALVVMHQSRSLPGRHLTSLVRSECQLNRGKIPVHSNALLGRRLCNCVSNADDSATDDSAPQPAFVDEVADNLRMSTLGECATRLTELQPFELDATNKKVLTTQLVETNPNRN